MSLPKPAVTRITNLDLLKGLVMIIMALDHTRDYFHAYSYMHSPEEIEFTTPLIFFTRWITHFCAPVFLFLAGTSAFLSGRNKSKKELSSFLIKRGIWLIILEVTIVGFGWFFNPLFSISLLGVIWVLGWSMIVLALLIHLPRIAIIIICLLMIVFHNALDAVHFGTPQTPSLVWGFLHDAFGLFQAGPFNFFLAYPLIPWVGVMGLGYCLGIMYTQEYSPEKRKRLLLQWGMTAVLLFIALRFSNIYGDPSHWENYGGIKTILSFLNVSKYPPSLLYLLMTLGPALIFLAFTENWKSKMSSVIMMYGRVPLFYYLLHIYLLHFFAMMAAEYSGFGWRNMIFTDSWMTMDTDLKGYGFSLPVVYAIWLGTVILLYPVCGWYDRYKQNNKHKWWLSYL
jgi:uncharacterized membrane protein